MYLNTDKSIIVAKLEHGSICTFATVTCMCHVLDLPYHTIKSLDFPFHFRTNEDNEHFPNQVFYVQKIVLYRLTKNPFKNLKK